MRSAAGRKQAVNAKDAKSDAEQRKKDENDPRTGKIIAVFHTNDTGLLLAIRGIAKQQVALPKSPKNRTTSNRLRSCIASN